MFRKILLTILVVMLVASWGCGSAHHTGKADSDFVLRPDIKIKVADVSNDTLTVSDVDMIGLLWDGLNQELHKESLLWTKNTPTSPLLLEAHIIKYQKGDDIQRMLLPGFGSTVLAVRCDVKDGDRVVATVEARQKVAYGDAMMTIKVWKKIFASVSEDAVKELRAKLRGGI
jgi:hypothetical protein